MWLRISVKHLTSSVSVSSIFTKMSSQAFSWRQPVRATAIISRSNNNEIHVTIKIEYVCKKVKKNDFLSHLNFWPINSRENGTGF